MKIFIGITTFNRKHKVDNLSASLGMVDGLEKSIVAIIDDASTEYDETYLKKKFPYAKIYRNERNLGADKNTFQLNRKFIESDADALFLCDSDLIVHPDALNVIERNLPKTDGLLSLLNSSGHPVLESVDEVLVSKRSVGAAGSVLSRNLVKKLIDSVEDRYKVMWDWYFCMYMKSNDKRIMATKQSYVFHTGIEGENSNLLLFEYSLGYTPMSDFESSVIQNFNQKFVENYYELSELLKIKVLIRKIVREEARRWFAKLFGEKRLLDMLVKKKMRLKKKGRK